MAISGSKDFLVFPNDNSGRVSVKEAEFTANGTWTAPAGITAAQVILVGAGGGGGGGSAAVAGGGGAGGQVVVKNISVTPGTSYAVNIGAGGQGGQGAMVSAADVVNTLPGGNGGTSSFGSVTYGNLLTSGYFDYGIPNWDGDVVVRAIQGLANASAITVYPNANGLSVGMNVSGTNLGTNTQIVSISGNVLNLSVANTATLVNTIGIFDNNSSTVQASNVVYNKVSNGDINSNAQGVGTATSPHLKGLSNNILQPNLSQLEDPTLVSGGFIRVYGTNPATISITNAGLPSKLAEQNAFFTITGNAASGTTTVAVSSVDGLAENMYVSAVAGIASGTTIAAIGTSSITLSTATTAILSNATLTVSYTGTVGKQAMLAVTGASNSSANPTWINWSSSTSSNNTTGAATAVSSIGVAYQPGATYTFSAYVSSNVDISSNTPIVFQLRSHGATYNAQATGNLANTNGVSNSGTTNSIDAGTANGFFVRAAIAAPLAGYGGAVTVTGTTVNSSASVTITSASTNQSGLLGIYPGMTVTGSGIQASTVVNGVSGSTITLSKTATIGATGVSLTFGAVPNVQVLGQSSTPGQISWRRISGTFTTPAIGATLANGQYAFGSTPQFIYPTVLLNQPNTSLWIDNVQLELGATPTTWQPPIMATSNTAIVKSTTANLGNLETSHRFIKATAGTTYAGSAFVLDAGTVNTYRPVTAFIEYFDKDYASLGRTNGLNTFLPITGVQSANNFGNLSTHAVRVGVTAVAPANTAYLKFGISKFQGATSATGGQVEFHVFYPQVETTSTTTVKFPGRDGYNWTGAVASSPLATAPVAIAEGGGGGGTYNSNAVYWAYGLEGGNNGGHAANGGFQQPTLAGGGAGAGSAGVNAIQYTSTPSGSTTFSYSGGFSTTAGASQPTFPMRGNNGGAAMINGSGAINAPGYAGDGGFGLPISGIGGNPTAIPLGGGGGGAGWMTNSQTLTVPGRGNGGGGKGGGTYLVQASNGTADYYARGIDGIANTGSGGGGGGSTQNNAPLTPITHNGANAASTYENVNADQYKWTPLFNSQLAISAQAGFYGSNVLRNTIQDVGTARVSTAWTSFAILPRTALYFPGVAARLTTAPDGVTSTQFPGLAKRVRPVVRWKDLNGAEIKQERPPFDVIFSGVNTVTYLGTTGATAGAWQTLPAPDNAAYFDIVWEYLYMDGGDVVDVDLNGVQYYGNIANGGNGADGYAIIRYYDKSNA